MVPEEDRRLKGGAAAGAAAIAAAGGGRGRGEGRGGGRGRGRPTVAARGAPPAMGLTRA